MQSLIRSFSISRLPRTNTIYPTSAFLNLQIEQPWLQHLSPLSIVLETSPDHGVFSASIEVKVLESAGFLDDIRCTRTIR